MASAVSGPTPPTCCRRWLLSSRFKGLLERKGLLEKWFQYEQDAQTKALREWCELNDVRLL
jgi:hypothetical protein